MKYHLQPRTLVRLNKKRQHDFIFVHHV